MKIAIYYPWINLTSGIERTILATLKYSKHDYTIFTNQLDFSNTFPGWGNAKIVKLNKIPPRSGLLSLLQSALIITLQKIDLSSFDLLIIHSEGISDLAAFKITKIPIICYCHTPLRQFYNSKYKKSFYSKSSFIVRLVFPLLAFFYKPLNKLIWKKYNHIIFNSRESFTRAKRANLLDIKDIKTSIIHPGTDWEKIKPSQELGKYFFLPGRISPSKNIELAIKAFILLEKQGDLKGIKLIIAGGVENKNQPYLQKLKSLVKLHSNIRFVENPTERRMRLLYKNCLAVIATAINEDWGLTPIEANSYAKPALCLNSGGYKESQIQNKTGFLIKNNENEFAKKMQLLIKNPNLAKSMGAAARIHSKNYSWRIFCARLDAVIDKVASK